MRNEKIYRLKIRFTWYGSNQAEAMSTFNRRWGSQELPSIHKRYLSKRLKIRLRRKKEAACFFPGLFLTPGKALHEMGNDFFVCITLL